MASAVLAEVSGGLGSIVSTIGNAMGRFYDVLKAVVEKVMDVFKNIIEWYLKLLVEKPEYGITLTALMIYMIT
ncbi:MAG: hypothetical protein QXS21_05450 [Thermoproteota archaeon]